MNEKLIKLNGTVIKKSICDTLGIYSRHVKVKAFCRPGLGEGYTAKWDVTIDGFIMPYWWSVLNDKDIVTSKYIRDITEDFCKKIKVSRIRKFINNDIVILEVKQIIYKLTLEYKLDLLN